MNNRFAVVLIGVFLSVPAGREAAAADRFPLERILEERLRYVEGLSERAQAWTGRDYSQAQPPASVDVVHYDLDLTLRPSDLSIVGKVTINAVVTESSIDSIVCDLYDTMEVAGVSVDDSPADYEIDSMKVVVRLDPPRVVDDDVRIDISYSGRPQAQGFGSFVFAQHGSGAQNAKAAFSLSEPWYAPTWWPCIDRPDDKATCRVTLTVPEDWTTASNGRLIDSRPAGPGSTRVVWEENYPIATYLVSVAATNYAVFHEVHRDLWGRDIDLDFYVYPEHLEKARKDFAPTGAMIDTLSKIFGPYPFADEKYGLAEFSFRGGMEHQTITGIGEQFIGEVEDYRWLLIHELAHQWFGDSLTPAAWLDIWLNEGFASYAEALYFEKLYGPESLSDYMAGFKRQQFAEALYDPVELFGITVYYKGAWVLHMLRRQMSDDDFFTALRNYADDYAYGSVTTDIFRGVCEDVSGQDLGWFFDQWVFNDGRPDFHYDWSVTAAGEGYELELVLDQVQAELFRAPLDIRLEGQGRSLDLAVVDSLRSQTFTFQPDFLPETLVIDPDGWLLADFEQTTGIEKETADRSVPRLLLDNPHPNPFNGAVSLPVSLPERFWLSLDIYNVLGEMVAEIHSGELGPGRHRLTWDGRDHSGGEAPSGLYFAVLSIPGRTLVRKVVLLR